MPPRNVYVPDDEVVFWDETAKIASRRGLSVSKQVCELVRRFAEENSQGRDLGLPVGFRIPASMKDPKAVQAEQVADDLRDKVLQTLLAAIELGQAP
jgi:hypothetical protein